MTEPRKPSLARSAGSAVFWKAVQLGAVRAIAVARTLVLARLLAPADFGLFALALVPIDFVYGITQVGVVPALVQQPSEDRRRYDTAWTIGLVRSAVIAVVLIIAAPMAARLLNEPRATLLVRILALRPLLGALTSIRVADLERELRFRRLAMLAVPTALVSAFVSIVLARALGVWALVVGTIAGTAVSAALSYALAPYRPRLDLDRESASQLLRFGRWIFAGALLGAATEALLRAVINVRLGTAALGVYFLAASLALLPNQVVAGLIGNVAFPIHARIQDDTRRHAAAFRASVLAMSAILLPVYALLFALAPALVRYVLDARWAGSANVIRVLSLAGLVAIGFAATEPLIEGRGRPAQVAFVYAIFTGVVAVCAWPLIGRYGPSGAGVTMLIAECAAFVTCVVLVRQTIDHPFAGLGRPLLSIAAVSILMALLATTLQLVAPSALGLLAAAAVSALAGIVALLVLDRRFDLQLTRNLVQAYPALLTLAPRLAKRNPD